MQQHVGKECSFWDFSLPVAGPSEGWRVPVQSNWGRTASRIPPAPLGRNIFFCSPAETSLAIGRNSSTLLFEGMIVAGCLPVGIPSAPGSNVAGHVPIPLYWIIQMTFCACFEQESSCSHTISLSNWIKHLVTLSNLKKNTLWSDC